MKLQNQIAIVTGGATGIGKAIATRLAQDGAHVIIASRRLEVVQVLVDELKATGLQASAQALDVSQYDAVDAAIKALVATHGKVDILVNNAGITRDDLLMRMKEADWDAVLDTNLKGAFTCTKAVCRPMMKARSGRIINISSVIGHIGNAGQVNYSAAKAGLFGLTKATARELSSRNITVNAVAPGYVQTEMTASLPQEAIDAFLKQIPLARPGRPEDIAAMVSFLAGPEAGYITGQVFNVDGGLVMS